MCVSERPCVGGGAGQRSDGTGLLDKVSAARDPNPDDSSVFKRSKLVS